MRVINIERIWHGLGSTLYLRTNLEKTPPSIMLSSFAYRIATNYTQSKPYRDDYGDLAACSVDAVLLIFRKRQGHVCTFVNDSRSGKSLISHHQVPVLVRFNFGPWLFNLLRIAFKRPLPTLPSKIWQKLKLGPKRTLSSMKFRQKLVKDFGRWYVRSIGTV